MSEQGYNRKAGEEGTAEPRERGAGSSASTSEPLPSLRGAPEHMRSQIIRTQNVEYQRRTRERRRAAYLELVTRHREQIEEIALLEQRVAALVQILETAGVNVPPAAADAVCETFTQEQQNQSRNSVELPGGERLFYELEPYFDDGDENA